MKRTLLAAALLVVVVNLASLRVARQNQRAATGGTAELTERELRLVPQLGESTVTLLNLKWEVESELNESWGPAIWLDQQRLMDLGFKCAVPVGNPDAHKYYGWQPPVRVFLVLEFEGEAWKRAQLKRSTGSRLFVVDAGLEAGELRRRYPDVHRHFVVQGLIRIGVIDRERPGGPVLAVPRLGGWVAGVLPGEIFVPRPHAALLRGFTPREDRGDEEALGSPRYSVTISWGAGYTPWIVGTRRLVPVPAVSQPGTGDSPR